MRIQFPFILCLLVANVTIGADSATPNEPVHNAVNRSIAWLERDMRAWRDEHGCAACHHGPMYLWSVGVAKRQGYRINESQRLEFTRWLLTDDQARVFPKAPNLKTSSEKPKSSADGMTAAMMGHRNLSQPTIYLAHALNTLDEDGELRLVGWKKLIEHFSSAQSDEGSFSGRDAWRPIFNTPQILTLFVRGALRDVSDRDFPEEIRLKRKSIETLADAFVSQQSPDDTQQGLVLRLLVEPDRSQPRPGASRSESASTIADHLARLQRSDGGWAQTDDRESDAFATGQALVALHRAGLTHDNASLRRGIDFLVRTQLADGTWPMTSRPNPETGKPAELLNPITYAAAAWATIGLTSCVPRQ